MLGNKADVVIWLKFQKLSGIFLQYVSFIIHCIYLLVCKGIRFIPRQTNVQPHFCDSMISPLEYEHFQLVITILQHPFDYSFHSYFCNHLHFHVISVTSFILKLKLNLCDSRPGSTQVSCKNPHKPACAAIAKIWTTCKTSYMLALRWVIFSCLVD